MLEVDGGLGLLLLAFSIHAIIDVVRADEGTVRHLPKQTWLFLVISLPEVGALIWAVAGRPERPVSRLADGPHPSVRRPVGPEDRADFSAWLRQLNVHPAEPTALPRGEEQPGEPPSPG